MQTRRVFVRNGALALVTLGFAPKFLTRTVSAAEAAGRKKILIAIFQRGAVDGLNVVVPAGESSYYSARPSIAIPRPGQPGEAAIDLDGFFAFHPRLAPLEPLFRRRHLAVVHACGSPDSTRSHFDAQDFMESGTPGVKDTSDGWLNRLLVAQPVERRSPFRAVAISPQLPRALAGRAPALALGQLDQFGVRGASAPVASGFEEEYRTLHSGPAAASGREAFEAVKILKAANLQRYQPAQGADYPRSAFGNALKAIAQLVKADVGLQVAFTEVGGWDTHVNQGASTGHLAGRLDDFAKALAALSADLDDRFGDVVILTMSEFGRTMKQNGNGGTDHGHGNAMLVIGGNVRGGRVAGRWPGLSADRLNEGRDLAVTTDFRDVFGEVALRHLGVEKADAIFPGYRLDPGRFAGLL
jgi:uncharacterized protein (DUF1501 family)